MDNDPSVKPAWFTTEFWLSLIGTILLVIKLFTGKDTSSIDVNALATLAVGIITAGYTISRALQKRAVIAAKAHLQATRMSIAYDREAQTDARNHEQAMSVSRSAAEQLFSRVTKLEGDLAARTPAKRTAART